MESGCPFCRIDKRRILEQGFEVVVLLSDPRLMRGHCLVVPRRHVPTLSCLSQVEVEELFATAIRVQERIKRVFPGAGCDLSQHDRPFMVGSPAAAHGLAVPTHVHVHLRPRTWQDDFWQNVSRHETPLFTPLPQDEVEEMRRLLVE